MQGTDSHLALLSMNAEKHVVKYRVPRYLAETPGSAMQADGPAAIALGDQVLARDKVGPEAAGGSRTFWEPAAPAQKCVEEAVSGILAEQCHI